jgi:hypothetical protein
MIYTWIVCNMKIWQTLWKLKFLLVGKIYDWIKESNYFEQFKLDTD